MDLYGPYPGTIETDFDAHLNDPTDAHDASAISVADAAGQFTGDDVEEVLAEIQDSLDAHLADAADAHDASAVSVVDASDYFTGTDVEAVLQELGADVALVSNSISHGLADAKGDLLVGSTADDFDRLGVGTDGQVLTADSAEPLGVKWAAGGGAGSVAMPDLTDVEAGPPLSGEAPVYDGAEFVFTNVATQTELDAHVNDAADAHDASAISIADAGSYFTGTEVEAALQEVAADVRERRVQIKVISDTTVLTTGDGKASFFIDPTLNGLNLTACYAAVVGASSSGTPTVQLRRYRSAVSADMLSTAITIDANELDSTTAATPPVINGSNDDVATGDRIFIDVDVAGTGTDGLDVVMVFS